MIIKEINFDRFNKIELLSILSDYTINSNFVQIDYENDIEIYRENGFSVPMVNEIFVLMDNELIELGYIKPIVEPIIEQSINEIIKIINIIE